ncbi:MAG: hypothetical protein P9L91_00490 [Candidatus Zophobacter franzmannii]|nr:hypothetical protein [Candidatus Zophobacter franzmannii]
MKITLILLSLILPLMMFAVLPDSTLSTLVGDEELELIKGKTVLIKVADRKTNKHSIVAIQKYLIERDVFVTVDAEVADFELVVDTDIVKNRTQRQANQKLLSVTLTCISNKDKRVIFVTNSEVPADTVHLKSGLRFKWYEPILFTVAIGSLVFGLWNLN